jgi:hypothetical protein
VHTAAVVLLVASVALIVGFEIAGRWRSFGGRSVGKASLRGVLVGLVGVTAAILWLALAR